MSEQFITVTLDKESDRILRELAESTDKESFFQEIIRLFDKLGPLAAGYITETNLSGSPLRRRTGNLARSVVGFGSEMNGMPVMRVGVLRGPATVYAGIQEFGTTKYNPDSPFGPITPKNAKTLAIPQEKVLTPAGVPRISGPRQYKDAFGSELVYVPFKRQTIARGALYDKSDLEYAAKRKLSLKDLKMAYLLLTVVNIKPTYWLSKGMKDYLPQVSEALSRLVKERFSGARRS